jgi:hypothetical protein
VKAAADSAKCRKSLGSCAGHSQSCENFWVI